MKKHNIIVKNLRDNVREAEAAARDHELALQQMYNESAPVNPNIRNNSKAKKLPSFLERKDQIDNFMQRFERYALANLWREEDLLNFSGSPFDW